MTNFSRGRRPENKATNKPPDNKSKNKAEEAAKQNAMLQLQRTFGNKAVIQMLMQQKNDTAGVKPQALGLQMVENFPLSTHPLILNGWSTVYQQVYAYCQLIAGYKNYVDKLLAGNALMLFYQYKGAFAKGIHSLLKGVMIPNIDTLILILRTVASGEPEEGEETDEGVQNQNDDGSNQKKDDHEQRLRVLEELKRELERRMKGDDIEQIHKRVPGVDPASINNPAMEAFQKDVMSGTIFSMGEAAYFESFLKKNDIDIEIFKLVVSVKDEGGQRERDTAATPQERLKRWQEHQQRLQQNSK
jgi:hypothetical protein